MFKAIFRHWIDIGRGDVQELTIDISKTYAFEISRKNYMQSSLQIVKWPFIINELSVRISITTQYSYRLTRSYK